MEIKVGVWGSNGYAGEELIKILSKKKNILVTEFLRETSIGKAKGLDAALLALPTRESLAIAPVLLSYGVKVIDLSGAFRLKDTAVFEKYYSLKHTAPELAEKAIYGLPAKNRELIKNAMLVANPGCYATAIELGLFPLVEKGYISKGAPIRIEAVSGYTGAGKKVLAPEEVTAYKPGRIHQHIPEIEAMLGIKNQIYFYPSVAPWPRGIKAVIACKRPEMDLDILNCYVRFYLYGKIRPADPFVTLVHGVEIEEVLNTNICQISPTVKDDEIIISVALDNLGKGAAGQAVQNFNLMFGLPEEQIY